MAQSEKQPQPQHGAHGAHGAHGIQGIHAVLALLTHRRGQQLAERELHDVLEVKLALAPQSDWDALHDAQEMYRAGQLTLAGYALLLWERLEAHNPDVYAYYEHISRTPVVWDGLQRLELGQWEWIAADRWTAWANGAARDASGADSTESEA